MPEATPIAEARADAAPDAARVTVAVCDRGLIHVRLLDADGDGLAVISLNLTGGLQLANVILAEALKIAATAFAPAAGSA